MEIAARLACLALVLPLGACSSGEERASTRPTMHVRLSPGAAVRRRQGFSCLPVGSRT